MKRTPAVTQVAPQAVTLQATLQRKDPRLPVYLVVPHLDVAPWQLAGTTVVEGAVSGHAFGRRTLKRWSPADASDWFLELTAPFCRQANIQVGDPLTVVLARAGNALPAELAALLDHDAALRAAWQQLSDYARRTHQEHVLGAKSAATRARRAAAVVDGVRARWSQPVDARGSLPKRPPSSPRSTDRT